MENSKYIMRKTQSQNFERISINLFNQPSVPTKITIKEKKGTMNALDFTIVYDDFKGRLITNEKIIVGNNEIPVKAFWDTGSTYSCISKRIEEKFKLVSNFNDTLHTGYGDKNTGVYSIDILLNNTMQIMVNNVSAHPLIQEEDIDLLIGMDVITMGDFRIYSENGKTYFNFKMK